MGKKDDKTQEIKEQEKVIKLIENLLKELKTKIENGFDDNKLIYIISVVSYEICSILICLGSIIPYYGIKSGIIGSALAAVIGGSLLSTGFYIKYKNEKYEYDINKSKYEYLSKELEKETKNLENLYAKKEIKKADMSQDMILNIGKQDLKEKQKDLEKKSFIYYNAKKRMDILLSLLEQRRLKTELLKAYSVEDAQFIENIVNEENERRLAYLKDDNQNIRISK